MSHDYVIYQPPPNTHTNHQLWAVSALSCAPLKSECKQRIPVSRQSNYIQTFRQNCVSQCLARQQEEENVRSSCAVLLHSVFTHLVLTRCPLLRAKLVPMDCYYAAPSSTMLAQKGAVVIGHDIWGLVRGKGV